MTLYGYACTVTVGPDLSTQEKALRAAGCQTIILEKNTGVQQSEKTELKILKSSLNSGDMLLVARIECLAHSLRELQEIVHYLLAKGVALKALEQPIDSCSASKKSFFDMLEMFVEIEVNMRREKQMYGVKNAKNRGVYSGRKPSIDADQVKHLYMDQKIGATEIATRLGIGRTSVYRVLVRSNCKSQPTVIQDYNSRS